MNKKYQLIKILTIKISTAKNINVYYPGASIGWDIGKLVGTQSLCATL